MKISIILVLATTVFLLSTGCKNETSDSRIDEKNVIDAAKVPTIVRDSFMVNYPDATAVTWEMAHEGEEDTYKAKFTDNGKYWKAEFRGNGSLIKGKEDE